LNPKKIHYYQSSVGQTPKTDQRIQSDRRLAKGPIRSWTSMTPYIVKINAFITTYWNPIGLFDIAYKRLLIAAQKFLTSIFSDDNLTLCFRKL
jgi:hypothetical protein